MPETKFIKIMLQFFPKKIKKNTGRRAPGRSEFVRHPRPHTAGNKHLRFLSSSSKTILDGKPASTSNCETGSHNRRNLDGQESPVVLNATSFLLDKENPMSTNTGLIRACSSKDLSIICNIQRMAKNRNAINYGWGS
jgi:hypothetical protein